MGDDGVNNNKKVKRIVFILLIIFLLQLSLITYLRQSDTKKQGGKVSQHSKVDSSKSNNAISEDESVKISNVFSKNIDTSKIILSDYEKGLVRRADTKAYNKNSENYEKILSEFSVTKPYRDEINKLIEKGYAIPNIFIAYNFLNDNYGWIKDLEFLVQENKAGMNWTSIFSKYKSQNKNYKPSDFSFEYLNKIIEQYKLSTEDIMLADRVSQLGGEKFEDIIKEKKNGKSWSEIKEKRGIINLQDGAEKVSIASSEVKKYISNDFKEQQAIDALVMARKLNKDASIIINEIKSGKSQEDIYAEYYIEKYN